MRMRRQIKEQRGDAPEIQMEPVLTHAAPEAALHLCTLCTLWTLCTLPPL